MALIGPCASVTATTFVFRQRRGPSSRSTDAAADENCVVLTSRSMATSKEVSLFFPHHVRFLRSRLSFFLFFFYLRSRSASIRLCHKLFYYHPPSTSTSSASTSPPCRYGPDRRLLFRRRLVSRPLSFCREEITGGTREREEEEEEGERHCS